MLLSSGWLWAAARLPCIMHAMKLISAACSSGPGMGLGTGTDSVAEAIFNGPKRTIDLNCSGAHSRIGSYAA